MILAAIVLAAGEGKRMKPLGASVPKVMLPILGKPVLDYVAISLIEAGIKSIILVVSPGSYRPVKKYFGTNFKGTDINYVVQEKQLGPAQALSQVVPKIESDFFFVQYGDRLADENIAKAVIDVLSKTKAVDGVLATREVDDPERYGIVRYKQSFSTNKQSFSTNQNAKIVEIVEKPNRQKAPSNHAVIGTFILKTAAFKKAIGNIEFIYDREIFPAQYVLAQGGKMVSWKFNGKSVDVGKPADLFAAGLLLTQNTTKCIAFDADNTLYNTHQVAKFADLAAFKILADKTGIGVTEIYRRWRKIVDKIKDSKNPKERTRLNSYGILCQSLEVDKEIMKKMYQQFSKSIVNKISPTQNIKKILETLKHKKVVITEDFENLAEEKLKATGIYKYFDDIVTSKEVGTMKPSKKYYEKLLKSYQPEEILVVGDDYLKDLKIPSELGMQVLFFENEKSLEKLLQIRRSTLKRVGSLERIHIMGIAGAGASAIAGIAKNYGYWVSGCDLVPNSPYVKNLKVNIVAGHNPKHLDDVDMLIISPAVEKLDPQNGELQRARQLKIPMLTWQQFQGKFLQKDKFVICVAGAYGKSTTTAMISQILTDAGLDPTCEIGAKVQSWQSNFRVGKSKLGPQSEGRGPHGTEYYVCEGDEYNNNFLNYKPDIAIVLNVDWDHPDFFKSRKEVFDAYLKFIANIKPGGTLVVSNDPRTAKLAKSARQDINIIKVQDFGKLKLKIIGNFRKQNASYALTVAKILGVDPKQAKKSVENFGGTGRRLEYKGEISGIKFYDDYAVQPYTILKTASALKEELKDKKVLLVLEPHTFSRIKVFFDDFVRSLAESKVDQIYITDVYAAREKGDGKALSQKLASAVGIGAKYTGSLKQTAAYVRKYLNDFDVICSMGAGDIYKLYDLIRA